MSRLMIIGAGMMQVPIIEKAIGLGHFVITVDRDENAPGNSYCNKFLRIDTHDKEGIGVAAAENNIDGILTTSDFPVRSVAYVSKKMGFHGLTEKAAQLCTNKYLLRKHLETSGYNVPQYHIIDKMNDKIGRLVFPLVIKPVDSSGSRGVKRVHNETELQTSYEYTKSFSSSGKVIIEEFIEGREFSVETLTQNYITHVIAITEKTVKGKNDDFFVESRHVIPAAVTKKERELISSTVKDVLKSIGLNDSSSHTEVMLNNKGVWVIEIGARLGGDFIASDLVPLATGVDMLENVIRISLGVKIDAVPRYARYAGIQFSDSLNYHDIKAFLTKEQPHIEKYYLEEYRSIELENSFSRLGYFIVSASDRNELLKTLDCKI